MNSPAIFSLKVPNPTKKIDDSLVSCTVGLPLNHAFSLGHGSIKVLPTPDTRAQQKTRAWQKIIQSL